MNKVCDPRIKLTEGEIKGIKARLDREMIQESMRRENFIKEHGWEAFKEVYFESEE